MLKEEILLNASYFLKDLINNVILEVQVLSINKNKLILKDLNLNQNIYRDLNQVIFLNSIDKKESIRLNDDLFSIQTNLIKAIISKNEIIQYSKNNFKDLKKDENTVIISITTPNDSILSENILNQFKDSLSIQFYDITHNEANIKIISDEIAKKIKNFIIKHKNDNFIVHCDAGQSRSAAVGLAIYYIIVFNENRYEFQISKNPIKEHPRYSPNWTVFNKIAEIKI